MLTFYSTRDGAVPTGHHAEAILKPLHLSPDEITDVKAFLKTLDDESLPPALLRAPPPADPPASNGPR